VSAQLLRDAANRLRKLADSVPGHDRWGDMPWRAEPCHDYMAAMHPAVARALAGMLDALAEPMAAREYVGAAPAQYPVDHAAIALARLVMEDQ
jgi:hypothetical protein